MISIRLNGDLAESLDEHVALSGQSQSDFLRSALIGYFAMYDAALNSHLSRISQSESTPHRIVWWKKAIRPHV